MDVPWAELSAVLVCVLLSILFSGSETALNALGQSRAERLIDEFKEAGRSHTFLEIWVGHRNEALICILFGNNLVNIAASALATVASEKMFAPTGFSALAVPMAVFVTTFLILTFGEIVPKTYAQNNPTRFLTLTRALLPFYWLLRLTGSIWFFAALSERLVAKAGGRIRPATQAVTEEDIEDHIERAAAQGNLDVEQHKLLSSVFQFDDTVVNEIMRPRTEIVGVGQDASLRDVLEIVGEAGFSRYPVYGEDLDDVVGVLYIRDLIGRFNQPEGDAPTVRQAMREPYIVPESKKISDLFREMQRSRTHLAMVVDEFGGTAGMVTVEDILEELVGEIYDEYDDDDDMEGEDLVRALSEDSWEVEARVTIRDVEEATGVEFPEDESYSTVAGLVLSQVGAIPDPGSEVLIDGVRLTVVDADAKRVISVRIDRLHPHAPDEADNPESS